MTTDLEKSFKARLRNLANEQRIDPAQLWQNLVLERFLIRFAQSEYANHFILKGGVLLSKYIELERHTKDLDFLVRKLQNNIETIRLILIQVMSVPLEDGFKFRNLRLQNLPHLHMKYSGVRASLLSVFGSTRMPVSLDFGFGDIVNPVMKKLPLISSKSGALFESEVEVPCYPKEFIFAKKLETIIFRGIDNSRMKDFHDLFLLIESGQIDTTRLGNIIKSVFKHRKPPLQLLITFSPIGQQALQQQWVRHLQSLSPTHRLPKDLKKLVAKLNKWLESHAQLNITM